MKNQLVAELKITLLFQKEFDNKEENLRPEEKSNMEMIDSERKKKEEVKLPWKRGVS